MKILVVEDEAPAREVLIRAIREADPAAEIVGELDSVSAAVQWLGRNGPPDLLFLDVQLSDGQSFEIFQKVPVNCPVVFATAFDSYLFDAFASNGIDYLLKPIRTERVAEALRKYRSLQEHFAPDFSGLIRTLSGAGTKSRRRFLVRKGAELQSVPIAEVAYFLTSGKLNFLVTKTGVRFPIDQTLAGLEDELPESAFFRANRAFLICADSIGRIHPFGKGKLLVELRPACEAECVVSQERAAAFRAWLDS